MPVKSKSASKTKPVVKKKSTVKPNKKITSKQYDFANLAEEIISNMKTEQSEERYRNIIENMQDGYYENDLAGNFTFFNDAVCKIHGYSREELLSMNYRQYTDKEDMKRALEAYTEVYRTGKASYLIDYGIIRKDGEKRQLEITASLIKDKSGKPVGFRGISRDVTERKQAEKTLLESEAKYRNILENMQDGYYEINLAGNFTFINDAVCKIHGYSREELLGMNNRQYTDKEDMKRALEAYTEVYRTGKASYLIDYGIIRKDGEKRQLEVTASLIKDKSGKPAGFRGISRDITEHKLLEETIKQSEQRYRTIIEQMEDGYFETDLTGNFTFINDAECRNLGFTREELIGTDGRQFQDEKTHKALNKLFVEVYNTGKPVKAYDSELIKKDKTKSVNEISLSLIRNSKGEPIGFRGIARDVTERKQAEEALQNSEEKYRNILESIQEGYYELDLVGNYTFVNEANCRFLGYTKEELVGMNFRKHTDEETAKKLYQSYNELYRTGKPIETLEIESSRKDGTKGIYETSVSLIRDSEAKPIGFRGVARDVTERKHHDEELALLRTAMDLSLDMIFLVDRTTMRFLYVNETAFRLTGYNREEYMKAGPQDILLVDRKTLEHAYDETIAAAPAGITAEMRTRRKDGTRTIVELHRRALNIGERWIIVTIMHDISQRWLAEQSVLLLGRMFAALSATNEAILHAKSPEELYHQVCNAAVDGGKFLTTGVLLFDQQTTWLRVAAASGADTDRLREARISFDEAIPEGKGLVGIAFRTGKPSVSNDYLKDTVSLVWLENAKNVRSVAVVPLLRGGQVIGALLFCAAEKRAFDGEIVKLLERMAENVVFALDNFEHEAERKRAEEKIQHMATHDALTGLPNRLMFSQLLNHAIQSAKRYQRQFAVFFIDLDRFKTINDTLGHEAGDQLLQEIAMRLKQTLRTVDVVARLGGDEFVILIEELSDLSQVETVAGKILSAVIKPVNLMNEECRITASIGISVFPKDAEDEQSLLKNADIAMYLAKEEGKNNYQFYSEDIQSKSLEHLSIETNLRFALERNELSLHYQAKLDFKTNAITGVEALLRWQNPSLGSVTPTQFIPVAEESGLIIPIGRWILRTACAQNAAWQQQGLPPVCMAVNLSLRQLTDNNLIDDIRTALNDSGMAPNLLELEITESMVMHNPTRMIAVLAKIKNLGVRLAIDDFGTGYSSLAQIKHFPIDTLKVDRSFIRNIPQDAEDKAVTEAIIAMGKALSLTVVAEGVETVEHMNFLNDHSCDEMQGFYFSKPIAPEQFADLLRKHVPSPGK
jgi:diguanylate cyclase (GGDEF)-like protein/PAS domain S-box-containing protein